MESKENNNEVKTKATTWKKDSSDYIAATVYLPKETNDNLKLLAIDQGLSKSSYIIKSVNEQIKRDSCKDDGSRNFIELKKMSQELDVLNDNVNALMADFKLLKSAVTKVLYQL